MKRTSISALIASVLAAVAGLLCGEEVPFIENFEDRTTGVLHDQHGWQARRQGDAQVQTDAAFGGDQAALVETNALAWNEFTTDTATNVWVDFYARVPKPSNSTAPSLTGSVAAAFYFDTDMKIRAISNDAWVVVDYTCATGQWHRFSVNLDYKNSTWELHVADDEPNALSTIVASNLAFSSSSTNEYFRRFRIKN